MMGNEDSRIVVSVHDLPCMGASLRLEQLVSGRFRLGIVQDGEVAEWLLMAPVHLEELKDTINRALEGRDPTLPVL